MKKDVIKTNFDEFVNEYNNNLSNIDSIVEMARIGNRQEINCDIFVNGGNSYGTGQNEHGEPHFHIYDNIKNPKFHLSILIQTNNEWKISKDLFIIEHENSKSDWNGLKQLKKELIFWLDEKSSRDKFRTNYEVIRYQWNFLNQDNKNVKQIEE